MGILLKQIGGIVLFAACCTAGPIVTVITENFDNVSNLPGWLLVNRSSPPGVTGWFQGNSGIFPSQSGSPNSYVAANFLNAGAGGDIGNWLISPTAIIANGATINFYSRTVANPAVAPDRLELRLSPTAGTSVGMSATSVGDFSELLLSINPSLSLTGYPSVWTNYTTTITGIQDYTAVRFAFRYTVPNTNVNADYIGIDSVQMDTPIPEPGTIGSGIALILAAVCRRRVAKGRL